MTNKELLQDYLKELDELELDNSDYIIMGPAAIIGNDLNINLKSYNNKFNLDLLLHPNALAKLIFKEKLEHMTWWITNELNISNHYLVYTNNKNIRAHETISSTLSYSDVFRDSKLINNYRYMNENMLIAYYQILMSKFHDKDDMDILKQLLDGYFL